MRLRRIIISAILFLAVATGPALLPTPARGEDQTPGEPNGQTNHFDARRGIFTDRFFTIGIHLGGGYTMPFKTDYTHVKHGPGFRGELLIGVTPTFSLRLSAGKSGVRVDDDKVLPAGISGAPWPEHIRLVDRTEHMTAVRYFVSAQYNSPPQRALPGHILFHIYGGLGFVAHHIDYEQVVVNDSTWETFTYASSLVDNPFAMTFGGGITVLISSHIGIEMAVGTDLVFAKEDSVPGGYPVSYYLTGYDGTLDLRLGVTIFL